MIEGMAAAPVYGPPSLRATEKAARRRVPDTGRTLDADWSEYCVGGRSVVLIT
jgi:hypothetical protein